MIRVQDPGLETTVQDTGRLGYYSIGFPPSGALDSFAYHVGNALVGDLGRRAGGGVQPRVEEAGPRLVRVRRLVRGEAARPVILQAVVAAAAGQHDVESVGV